MIVNAGVECEPQPDCIRCGRPGPILHEVLVDRLFDVPGEWSMRRCPGKDCGLAWIDPQPHPDQIGKFYASYYTHASEAGNPFLDALPSPRKRRIKRLLGTLLFWRKEMFRSGMFFLEDLAPGRLLDVGCGNGAFLVAAETLGWQPVGIDFDAAAVEEANRHPGVEARVGGLIDCAFPAAGFDVVTLNNVIEHLPNPAEIFAECARILRPGGRLVVMTPNIDALGHDLFGPDWRGLEPPRHLYMFSPGLLARYARSAGFARTKAFSYSAAAAAGFNILPASRIIAERAGRTPPEADLKAVERKEKLLDLLGILRGENAILIAHR